MKKLNKKLIGIALVLLIILILAGVFLKWSGQICWPGQQQAKFFTGGPPPGKVCYWPAMDAGKICNRSTDCQSGFCVIDNLEESKAYCGDGKGEWHGGSFLDENGVRSSVWY